MISTVDRRILPSGETAHHFSIQADTGFAGFPVKNKSQFQLLMDKLPSEHKAKWFAGAALNTADRDGLGAVHRHVSPQCVSIPKWSKSSALTVADGNFFARRNAPFIIAGGG